MALDAYTIKHLDAYIEVNILVRDAFAFRQWVIEQLEEDPEISNLGWPSLYRTWINHHKEGSA